VSAEDQLCCGVVVIGRNEGARLKACLASIQVAPDRVVYVDSGSGDGSVQWARSQGVVVVELDMSSPFTAGRARNAGFSRLITLWPDTALVQFVDGDCELAAGWLRAAESFLLVHPDVAVVCGRRRERFPRASRFNAQCDREWNTPIGEARACGGDAMYRRSAFASCAGFRESLIAGEEPELCLRLRAAGWKVWRIDHEMTLHDAALLRWGQWWRRTRRSGHAFAEGAWLHGAPPERHWVVETRRAAMWGLALPLAGIAAGALLSQWFLLLFLLYPLQVARLVRRSGTFDLEECQQAMLLVLGRIPEGLGAARFWYGRLLRRHSELLEYK
jgi:hypothetical protein